MKVFPTTQDSPGGHIRRDRREGPLTAERRLAAPSFGLGLTPFHSTPTATTNAVCGFCSTGCGLELEEGSLYPALYRMEKRGWLDAEWGTSELGRRAKFYRLTRTGRQQLASHTAAWAAFSAAVNRALIKAV